METMKRSLAVALALAFGLASGVALAESTAPKPAAAASKAVQMTDAEMDNVTAGSAFVAISVFNQGNGSLLRVTDNVIQCINCADVGLPVPFVTIFVDNGVREPTLRCVGRFRIC